MLGIFGMFPAIDTYFTEYYNIYRVNNKSIDSLYKFYIKNAVAINRQDIYTLDYDGNETTNKYKKAKMLDMVGWIKGNRNV